MTASEGARYFLTVADRLAQPPVSSIELMPSPSMYDELLRPLWWTPAGVAEARP
jgi:hypothetical protein